MEESEEEMSIVEEKSVIEENHVDERKVRLRLIIMLSYRNEQNYLKCFKISLNTMQIILLFI